MALLSNVTVATDIKAERDSVGFSGPMESGIYPGTISMAYLEVSTGEALAVVLDILAETGQHIRTKLWVQSGAAKGKKNFYVNKTSGEKTYLPGFNAANSLALLTVGKPLGELVEETKTIKVYSYEAKADVPTEVPVLTELLDQQIYVGLIKQTVDKQAKDGSGSYVNSGETRDENEVDKFFRRRDKLTTAEILAGATEAKFFATWAAKNSGVTRNKSTGVSAAASSTPAYAKVVGPTVSLFG